MRPSTFVILTSCVIGAFLMGAFRTKQFKPVQAHVLFRHGNRTPIWLCPNDPNSESTWTEGLGHLTKVGEEMSNRLGWMIRTRFVKILNFLTQKELRTKLHIRSTNVNRTIETAMQVLKALFYGEKPSVHIEIIPKHLDDMFRTRDFECPYYKEAVQKIYKSDVWQKKEAEEAQFFRSLSTLCGCNLTLKDATRVYQSFQIELENKRQIPHWVTPDMLRHLKSLSDFKTSQFYNDVKDRKYLAIIAGVFLHKVITDFEAIVSASPRQYVINLYSAHDTNVMSVLAALGIPVHQNVNYNSALSFELYRINNLNEVRLFFRNASANFEYHRIPNCDGIVCTLSDLKKLYGDIITPSIEPFC